MTQEHDNSNDPLHAKKKAWSGRFSEPVDAFVLRYTASVDFDKRMASPVEKAKRMRIEFEAATEALGNALLPSALAVGESLLPLLQPLPAGGLLLLLPLLRWLPGLPHRLLPGLPQTS